MLFSRFAQSAAFARLARFAVIGLALVGNGANATQLIYGTYYDEYNFNSCTGQSTCIVSYSELSTSSLTMINRLNCNVASTVLLVSLSLQVSSTPGGTNPVAGRVVPLGLPSPTTVSGTYSYNFGQDLQYLIGQGRYPYVIAITSPAGSMSISCTIVGTLVTPIQ
jgi:hypothetical protein